MKINWLLNKSTLYICLFQPFLVYTAPRKTEKIWWHPYLAKMTIRGTLSSKKTKKVVNSIFGGTPDTTSQYPCVPRHLGWEPRALTMNKLRKKFPMMLDESFSFGDFNASKDFSTFATYKSAFRFSYNICFWSQ